jgi:formyl-CoA transferase
MSAPLKNIRVLDMSRVLAGPWATQLLGDYGADVIKIERPNSGDDTRHWGPPWLGKDAGESAYFLSANRNKRSVTVNIASENGQELLRELVQKCDVLIENYKVGTLQRYGLGADEMLALNPRLIYCSISAFGQTGSRSDEPGYDAMIQASGGLMSITGNPGEPQKVGVAISDIMAGMYASTAILAALNARASSGAGQYIDVPLYDSQVAWLANQNMNFLIGGKIPQPMGNAHPNLVPYQTFATSDGSMVLAVGNDRQFVNCCNAIGLTQLASDGRFTNMSQRVENRDQLIPMFEAVLRNESTSHWLTELRACGVPAGPVNDIGEVLTNEYAQERQLVGYFDNGNEDSVPYVANPVEFSATPVDHTRAPPLLGEHTDEVLRELLGYSDAQIEALRKSEVI